MNLKHPPGPPMTLGNMRDLFSREPLPFKKRDVVGRIFVEQFDMPSHLWHSGQNRLYAANFRFMESAKGLGLR